MITEIISEHFRSDGVNIKITRSQSYINRATLEVVPSLPEDAVASEWATYSTFVRKDQSGEVFDVSHELEDTENTYTEVYLTPDSYSELTFGSSGSSFYAIANRNMYPTYSSAKTYAKGDIVAYDHRTWISDMDDNVGNTPNIWGWSMYLPYIEEREPHYGTYEEIYGSSTEDVVPE